MCKQISRTSSDAMGDNRSSAQESESDIAVKPTGNVIMHDVSNLFSSTL